MLDLRRTAAGLLAAAATLGPVASASASSAADKAIYQDCNDGKINGTYSQADFASALRNIPTDVDEYSDCRDLISRARLGGSGGSGGSGSTAAGGAVALGTENSGKTVEQVLQAASPAERATVAEVTRSSPAVQVGSRLVSPTVSGLSPAGAANVVPTPLGAALALLALGLAAAAGQLIRSRVLARRGPSA